MDAMDATTETCFKTTFSGDWGQDKRTIAPGKAPTSKYARTFRGTLREVEFLLLTHKIFKDTNK